MSELANPNARFADDHGEADPITRQAIARVDDQMSYIRALVALCSSRLLMPIVATGDETGEPDPNRRAEMSAVKLVNEHGEFLLAFTGLDSMQLWNADARPVPCTLDELCATVQESGANQLLIDVAGPASLVVAGEALNLLAQGYAVAEFEGEEFAWVRYERESALSEEDAQRAEHISQLEASLATMEQIIDEAERAEREESDE